ncbi:MAG TPA: SPFH/Band 7/PHB domain protein [Thermotogaceae bacterium]|nr:SPFH/Band 7/PHB domain protein [Thermotogaceae bacterium]
MLIFWGIIAFFILVIAASGIRIVRPYERGLIERLGKFKKEVKSGLHFIIPFFDRMIKVDMREMVIDVPPQEVITKDNVVVTVDAVIYYEITDAFRVIYNVGSFQTAAVKLAQTNLRNVIGELELDQTLTSREAINAKLREVLDEATDKWGVKVTRVEIKKIDPPNDIMEAMSRQMKAERTKRAAILEAEGVKQSEILRAEGQRQAAILKAEGEAEAIKKVAAARKYQFIAEAEGQAKAIIQIFGAIHEGNPSNDLLAVKYLDALKEIANGKATKIFLPLEASGILGSIAGISELFKEKKDQESEEN